MKTCAYCKQEYEPDKVFGVICARCLWPLLSDDKAMLRLNHEISRLEAELKATRSQDVRAGLKSALQDCREHREALYVYHTGNQMKPETLAAFRKRKGWSQARTAAHFGLAQSAVSRIESEGGRVPLRKVNLE